MAQGQGEVVEMVVQEVRKAEQEEGYHPVDLSTSRGNVQCRFYPAEQPGARLGAIWVGGAGGGWDSPARGLYPALCRELAGDGIASLRVRYRRPNNLGECTLDVLAGIAYLELENAEAIAVTGHSFGGAVAIQAAAGTEAVRTVVTLATQSYGTAPAATLAPHCSILLIHGQADTILPPSSSQQVYRLAAEPKRILLYEGAQHGLDEVAGEVRQAVREWVTSELQRTMT